MFENRIELKGFKWEDFKETLKWHKPDYGFDWRKGVSWFYIGWFWYDAPHYVIRLGPWYWYLGHFSGERPRKQEKQNEKTN